MRRIGIVFACAALALSLAGCGNIPTEGEEHGSPRIVSDTDTGAYCVIFTDTETGVQYMYVKCGYGVAITPMYNADGTPYVDGE